jgi:hypothetical protein
MFRIINFITWLTLIVLSGAVLALICIYIVDTLTIYGAIVLLGLTFILLIRRREI